MTNTIHYNEPKHVHLRSSVLQACAKLANLDKVVGYESTTFGANVTVPGSGLRIETEVNFSTIKIRVHAQNEQGTRQLLQAYDCESAPSEVLTAIIMTIVTSLA